MFVLPTVANVQGVGGVRDGVAGAQGGVGLFVELVGDEGDGVAGDDLADEDDAAPAGAVGVGAGDVEAEVYFFKTGVEGDGEVLEADFFEEEADEGDVAVALVEVELDARGYPWGKGFGGHFVLRHDELAPLGSEEGGHLSLLNALFDRAVSITGGE